MCTSLPLGLRTGRAGASGVRSRGSVTAKHGGKATGKVELGEVGGTGRTGLESASDSSCGLSEQVLSCKVRVRTPSQTGLGSGGVSETLLTEVLWVSRAVCAAQRLTCTRISTETVSSKLPQTRILLVWGPHVEQQASKHCPTLGIHLTQKLSEARVGFPSQSPGSKREDRVGRC